MHISKIRIENFKCFEGAFCLVLNSGINILAGNNEAGKSTILEATHLALSGVLHGRYLRNELSQYLFNKAVENKYIESISAGNPIEPPYILIELYFDGPECAELALLEGNENADKEGCSGISFRIEFDEQYRGEYAELLVAGEIKSIPIEYYRVNWRSFAREGVTAKGIPIKSSIIDSAGSRFHNGSDVYISRIVRENLDEKERVEISQAHRNMKETFMNVSSVKAINKKLSQNAQITDKKVSISVDLSTQNAWETSLMTYLDDVPFHYIGKGEQSVVKTNLALSHKKSREANIVLLEEPENHLSFSKLNELIGRIKENTGEKQVIVSTHSSFVANKLGLDHLILLNDRKSVRLNDLTADTKKFFSKLAGYDTLRLILCRKAILVEGDSDELVIQKAYMEKNNGKLPIEDGVDVISVGTSFLRFLEVAQKIGKHVSVVTDNDGDVAALKKKYATYIQEKEPKNIRIFFDEVIEEKGDLPDFNYNTLEPKLLKANSRKILNRVFGKEYATDDELLKYMNKHKTECALGLFESSESVNFPNYILEAITG